MDVRQVLIDCTRDASGVASAAQLRAAGITRSGLSRALARGEVVRVRPGVYSCAELTSLPIHLVTSQGVSEELVQQVRAVLLSLGPAAAAAGATAACLRGWGLLHEPRGSIQVAVPRGRSRVRLARVRTLQRRVIDGEAWTPAAGHQSLQVTSAVRTVIDCCRELPVQEAVVVCDSALRSGQVSLSELRAARLSGHRRAARVRRVLELCDPECGSVLESVLRLALVEAGLIGFSTQRVIRDARGRRVLRVDFAFPQHRLVVEADGSRWHPDPHRDRTLDNRLVAAGWRVLRFTWAEVVHDPAKVLDLVRAALQTGSTDCHLREERADVAA